MLTVPLLKELLPLIGIEALADMLMMQQVMDGTLPQHEDMQEAGRYAERCHQRFMDIGNFPVERARRALALLLACDDYLRFQEMKGLGGCQMVPLATCIERAEQELKSGAVAPGVPSSNNLGAMRQQLEVPFTWVCPACRKTTIDLITEDGPVLEVICDHCESVFQENDLTPKEAAEWAAALDKVLRT